TVGRDGPEPTLEIHCHGGLEVVRLLTDAFAAQGVQACSFSQLVRAHSVGTRSCAEAGLARALTVRAASILLDQAEGAFDAALTTMRQSFDGEQALFLI